MCQSKKGMSTNAVLCFCAASGSAFGPELALPGLLEMAKIGN